METGLLISALVSLFVVIDPVGTSAVFAALTQDAPIKEQKRIAIRGVLTAIILLVLFNFLGQALLKYMHVSLPAFRIAGGLLLFVTAFRMIMGFTDPNQLNSKESVYQDRSNIAIFPLAIPLLAGPGAMTASLMFSTEAKGLLEHSIIIFAIIVIQTIALLCLLGAAKLNKIFGQSAQGILARVMGVLLAAMAVQFVSDGIKALIQMGTN